MPALRVVGLQTAAEYRGTATEKGSFDAFAVVDDLPGEAADAGTDAAADEVVVGDAATEGREKEGGKKEEA